MLLRIPVYSDSPAPAEEMVVDYSYIEEVAKQVGLEQWIPDTVSYYTCCDGAVLVIWGSIGGKTHIRGVVLPLAELKEDSHFLQVWERCKATDLSVEEVYAAISSSQKQLAN